MAPSCGDFISAQEGCRQAKPKGRGVGSRIRIRGRKEGEGTAWYPGKGEAV